MLLVRILGNAVVAIAVIGFIVCWVRLVYFAGIAKGGWRLKRDYDADHVDRARRKFFWSFLGLLICSAVAALADRTTALRQEVAVLSVEVRERLRGYTVVSCRLETGRTHQIRIHLSELGHPVCGERVYNREPNEEPTPDASGAPRLALHAAELGLDHPATGEAVHWTMDLSDDLRLFLERLRQGPAEGRGGRP